MDVPHSNKKKCQQCGETFYRKKKVNRVSATTGKKYWCLEGPGDFAKRQFCSHDCAYQHRRKPLLKTCEICGARFGPNQWKRPERNSVRKESRKAFFRRRFCSRPCQALAASRSSVKKRLGMRVCPVCNSSFEPSQGNRGKQKYCSRGCGVRGRNSKRGKWNTLEYRLERYQKTNHADVIERQKAFVWENIRERLLALPQPVDSLDVERLIEPEVNRERDLRPLLWGTVRQVTEELQRIGWSRRAAMVMA